MPLGLFIVENLSCRVMWDCCCKNTSLPANSNTSFLSYFANSLTSLAISLGLITSYCLSITLIALKQKASSFWSRYLVILRAVTASTWVRWVAKLSVGAKELYQRNGTFCCNVRSPEMLVSIIVKNDTLKTIHTQNKACKAVYLVSGKEYQLAYCTYCSCCLLKG